MTDGIRLLFTEKAPRSKGAQSVSLARIQQEISLCSKPAQVTTHD